MRPAQLTQARLALPSVTLVTVTSVAVPATARAMALCLDQADFGAALWCSDQSPPAFLAGRVDWCRTEPLGSRGDYSRFVLRQLGNLVRTDHALITQWDGYIIEPQAWEPDFLSYDYVGAPWPHFVDGMTVGNGGFSLRSRRLLDLVSRFPDCLDVEDVAICRTWRPRLEQEFGIRYAPEALASRFAYERRPPEGATFGFHGAFNLPDLIPENELVALLEGLELPIMAPNEMNDLIRHAARKRQVRLAMAMLRRKLTRWMTGMQSRLGD